jgi:farnesol dehydrogenase
VRVLLTGGSGFLGRRLAAALADRHRLRLLLRPGARRDDLPPVEVAAGDVTDRGSLERAVAGCDAVVHAAALVRILAPAAEFDRVNVGGLENLLAAAGAVGHLVHVSSFMALGPSEGAPDGLLDEEAEPRDRRWINDYERTKTLADRRARRAIAEGAPVSVVYPGVIYGPGELTEGNLLVRHLLDLAAGRVPALLGRPERRWCYVHVEDVVAGVVATLERPASPGTPGNRYVLGGENATSAELYRLIAEIGGIAVPRWRMPAPLATLLGAGMKGWARLAGGVPKRTPDLVEVYRHDWAYRSDRARRELGYAPRTLAAGLAETVDWLRGRGLWR